MQRILNEKTVITPSTTYCRVKEKDRQTRKFGKVEENVNINTSPLGTNKPSLRFSRVKKS